MLRGQLDEALLVLEERGCDHEGLMLCVALLLQWRDEGPAQETG